MNDMSNNDNRLIEMIRDDYEEIEMDTVFRESLLLSTSSIIAQRKRTSNFRRLLALTAGIAVVTILVVILIGSILRVNSISTGGNGNPQSNALLPTTPDIRHNGSDTPRENNRRKIKRNPMQKSVLPKKPAFCEIPNAPRPASVNGIPKPVAPESASSRTGDSLVAIEVQSSVTDGMGRTLKLGDRLAAGSTVSTGAKGRLVLLTRQGTRIYLASNTMLSVPADNTTSLISGRIYVINRNGEIRDITTPAGNVQLLGTTLDTAVMDKNKVAITVVSGQVRLKNRYGQALVKAGTRSVLMASAAPVAGDAVDTIAATAWFDGRGMVVSDFGRIAYIVRRERSPVSEIWTMNTDGSDRWKVISYLGYAGNPGPWLPGDTWLGIQMYSALWTTPDFKTRTATAGAGHPITASQSFLVNASTGQDVKSTLPKGYDTLYTAISPDGRCIAFTGSYRKGTKENEGGLWVFDTQTGKIVKLLDGWLKTPPAWSPDGESVAVSEGQGYGNVYPFAIVNAKTLDVERFNLQGAGPAISPDGKRVAYCGDFKQFGSWSKGVPMSGSIFVMDLESGADSKRLTPEGEGSLEPCWSPDGSKILYVVRKSDYNAETHQTSDTYQVFTMGADGSDRKLISGGDDEYGLSSANWSNDGKSVFIRKNSGMILVNADGSGIIADLGGNAKDSVTSTYERNQSYLASKAVNDAIYQFALGNVRLFEGKPDESRNAYRESARLFAEAPWRYPAARLSISNIQVYADAAQEKIRTSDNDAILAESCQTRIGYLNVVFNNFYREKKKFPESISELEEYTLKSGMGINWIFVKENPEWARMFFLCPGTMKAEPLTLTYIRPAGDKAKDGEVIITCPNHPQNKLEFRGYW